ncbi:MAG: tetratricopeptide repeat protein [Clostridia bacterium]|nr:tetratricopeptide repeat protein [Clostridia bacterium]
MYAPLLIRIIMYIMAVIIPILVIISEKRGHNYSEILSKWKSKFFLVINDTKSAKNELISLVSKYPESYIGHKMLAEIYEKEGGMRKAIDEYVKAIDCQKNDYDSYYKVAYLLYELGQKDRSETMLRNLLKKKPDHLQASILFGDVLCEQEKFKEAINVYTDALRYSPNDYDLYYGLGMAYTRLNDFQNAKICYEKAAEINHELYYAKYYLGQISLLYRDIESAEEYFTECLYSNELEPSAYFELSKIYMLKGERENAITFVNKAIELDISYKKKADEEPILIPIKPYIVIPKEEEIKSQVKRKINKKAKANIEYLEKTYHVVENLNLRELGKQVELKRTKKENEKTIDNSIN